LESEGGIQALVLLPLSGYWHPGARSNVMAAVHGKNSQASFDKVLVNVAIYFTQPNLVNPIYQTQVALVIITGVVSIRTQIDHHMSTAGCSLKFQASRSSAEISIKHPDVSDI
jgi:hypothetical protein